MLLVPGHIRHQNVCTEGNRIPEEDFAWLLAAFQTDCYTLHNHSQNASNTGCLLFHRVLATLEFLQLSSLLAVRHCIGTFFLFVGNIASKAHT